MIALLLGIISLVISIMFTNSFDKLANEVRDIRIKYLKIDHILKFLKLENEKKKQLEGFTYDDNDFVFDFDTIYSYKDKFKDDTKETITYHDHNVNDDETYEYDNIYNVPDNTTVSAEETIYEEYTNNKDYYKNNNFKEMFKKGDIIEVFH